MSTALDLIKDAHENLGLLAEGESLSAESAQKGLRTLNQMIASWNTQNYIVQGITIENFTLVAGQQSYTIGSGGDFDTTVPVRTDKAYIRLSGNEEKPLHMIDNKRWGEICLKTTQSTFPDTIYIDKAYPLKTIYLYPVPSEARTLILHNYKQISSFAALTTAVSLPQGYEEAITYNLSIRLAPKFGKSIPPEISSIASESLSNIKRVNVSMREAQVDPALLGRTVSSVWRYDE